METFKMEIPEIIKTSLQQGEWVTSIDFKDAYFHIPINPLSRKYLCFHVKGRLYQFKALLFCLSTFQHGSKECHIDGSDQRNKNSPVSGRLVNEGQFSQYVHAAHRRASHPLSRSRLDHESGKISWSQSNSL